MKNFWARKIFWEGMLGSLPLSLFLISIQLYHIQVRADWLLPYALGSLAAVSSTVYLLRAGRVLNRLSLGINLYLISGLLALLLQWDWLNHTYGELRGIGMLLWILGVGAVTSWFSPYGFLGVGATRRDSLEHWLLLLLSLVALFIAASFSAKGFWGEWFPFIVLFAGRGFLYRWSLNRPRNAPSPA